MLQTTPTSPANTPPLAVPPGLRPAVPADLPALMAIERVSFPAPWTEAMFAAEFTIPWSHVVVIGGAPAPAPLAGFIVYWIVADELHINHIAVLPEARRQGYGARLMEHALREAKRRQCTFMTLEVRRSNTDAIRLYERYGFKLAGVRPGYYQDSGEDAAVMVCKADPTASATRSAAG